MLKRISFAEYRDDGAMSHGWKGVGLDSFPEGQSRAEELAGHVNKTNDVPLFVRVIRDALRSEDGKKSPTVSGFLFHIGTLINSGAT